MIFVLIDDFMRFNWKICINKKSFTIQAEIKSEHEESESIFCMFNIEKNKTDVFIHRRVYSVQAALIYISRFDLPFQKCNTSHLALWTLSHFMAPEER